VSPADFRVPARACHPKTGRDATRGLFAGSLLRRLKPSIQFFLVTKLCLVTLIPETLLSVMNREAESRRAGMCSPAELGNKVELT
jgi:hypothetical protein